MGPSFKAWSRTVHQESVQGKHAKSELGLSGDMVMKLASKHPAGQNYRVYRAEDFFSSVPLLVRLLESEIHFVGTLLSLHPFLYSQKSSSLGSHGGICIFFGTQSFLEWSVLGCNTTVDCRSLQIPEKEVMKRRHFQAQLASSFIQINTLKRGRPSMDEARVQNLSAENMIHNTVLALLMIAGIIWGTAAGTAGMDIH